MTAKTYYALQQLKKAKRKRERKQEIKYFLIYLLATFGVFMWIMYTDIWW